MAGAKGSSTGHESARRAGLQRPPESKSMSRYFFHVVDDQGREQDVEGGDFATDHLARIQALGAARALLCCGDPGNRCALNWRIEVTDGTGQFKFDFLVEHARE